MNSPLPSLLHRPPLQPGESLPFFLLRLAHENCYHIPTMVIQLGRERLSRRDMVTRPTRSETYRVLSELTGVEADQLYAACVHRFAATLTPPSQPPQPLALPSGKMVSFLPNALMDAHLWSETKAQFCPLCWQQAPYHRIDWLPLASAVCLDHHCLLVRACPACAAHVPLQALLKARCQHCQLDLTQIPPTLLTGDTWGLFTQTVLRAWLGLAAQPPSQPLFTLPDHSPAVLYRLVDTLRRGMLRLDPHWEYLHRPLNGLDLPFFPCFSKQDFTPAKSYLLFATAFKALLNWPQGFFDFLNAYKLHLGPSDRGFIRQDFDYLYTACVQRLWRHPAFHFVQDAFDQYLLANYPAEALSRLHRSQPNPARFLRG